jgi:hypothetical protein
MAFRSIPLRRPFSEYPFPLLACAFSVHGDEVVGDDEEHGCYAEAVGEVCEGCIGDHCVCSARLVVV